MTSLLLNIFIISFVIQVVAGSWMATTDKFSYFFWKAFGFRLHNINSNKKDSYEFDEMRQIFGIIKPHLPEDILDPTGRLILGENFPRKLNEDGDCDCPRIYFPVCGKNNITYSSICILQCIGDTEMRRLAECISYRRSFDSSPLSLNVSFPAKWFDESLKNEVVPIKPNDKLIQIMVTVVPENNVKTVDNVEINNQLTLNQTVNTK